MSKKKSYIIRETTKNRHSLNTSKWADLPKDILVGVVHRLDDYKTDVPRLRGVCPSWRNALPFAEFPMREIHLEVPRFEDGKNHPLFLLKTRYYLFYPVYSNTSSDGWIARVGELGINKWCLLNPLHSNVSDVKDQRYFTSDPHIRGEINLLDTRVVELARPMSLVHKLDYDKKSISKKVVAGERAVLVLLELDLGGGLMLWRFGDQEWVKIEGIINEQQQGPNLLSLVLDIAFHNGKFYAFQMTANFECLVWVISPGDCLISKQVKNVKLDMFEPNERLNFKFRIRVNFVPNKCNDGLYLVMMKSFVSLELRDNDEYKVNVFMLKDENIWEIVENIGDITFFLGSTVSFALPPSPGNLVLWKSNSIYSFSPKNIWSPLTQMPMGLTCLERIMFPPYNEYFKLFIIDKDKDTAAMSNEECQELCSRLFFPPPAWVKWRCPTLNDAEVRFDGLRYLA